MLRRKVGVKAGGKEYKESTAGIVQKRFNNQDDVHVGA